jgi:type III restriction enzyme
MNIFSSLNNQSKQNINAISSRLSLRQPQRDSLEILAHVLELIPTEKVGNLTSALSSIQKYYSSVQSFDRDFVSLCFALATGIGKTRLMGAFIALLFSQYKIKNFFVLAPNLTIYEKLINDFSPTSSKYVLLGLQEFANNPPRIITGDNYDSGINVGKNKLFEDEVTINIFNIAKINSEVRGGKTPRIKRLSEYIGESYFDYLANLDDLVMIMDESHRYRATAGFKAINDLRPILGLELTATPQVETGSKPIRFTNIIYDYPLANAIADGFVKEPAVATREDFKTENYGEKELESLKIKDGIIVHERTKIELATFAYNNNTTLIKPFMLIVAKDTSHADQIVRNIKHNDFFEGRYKDKVITVHSNQRGEESDETIARLLAVEETAEPTEIVVHVDKLKEGWDVRNLYTIVPLRAANSATLVEQSIGRGLRLPYGKRTGVATVDKLTIIAHDKFDNIIEEAKKPNSIIRSVVRIGKDISLSGKKFLTVNNSAIQELIGSTINQIIPDLQFKFETQQQPQLKTRQEHNVVNLIIEAIKENENQTISTPNLESLIKPNNQENIIKKVTQAYEATYQTKQIELEIDNIKPDIKSIVKDCLKKYIDSNISIPRISVRPKGTVKTGFKDFDLDVSAINQQPVSQNILIQELRTNDREKIYADLTYGQEDRLENYIVRKLIDFEDINYEQHSEILYKLSGQIIAKIRSYLKLDSEVINVIQFNQVQYANIIHAQMQNHWWQKSDDGYEVVTNRGYQTLTPVAYTIDGNEKLRNVHQPLVTGERERITGMLFNGFKKCSYTIQKFGSDPERIFACVLETDLEVKKWFKPTPEQFAISYHNTKKGGNSPYEPDFIVETSSNKFVIEIKQTNLMNEENVIAKQKAALMWCENAKKHEISNGGKPWLYLLIPHSAITPSATLNGLLNQYKSKN